MQEELGSQFGDQDLPENPVMFSSWFRLKEKSREGVLSVKLEIAPNWHVYSLTQPKGGPIPASISVPKSLGYEITGPFEPDADPHVIAKDDVFGVRIEYHEEQVIWSAPIRIAENADPAKLAIEIKFRGQTCVQKNGVTGSCLPLSEKIVVTFDGYEAAANAETKFQPKTGHVLFNGKITKAVGDGPMGPGDLIQLEISAEPQGDFHIYAYAAGEQGGTTKPTLIAFTKSNGWEMSGPTANPRPITKTVDKEQQSYHHDPVVWTFKFKIPTDAESRVYSLAGLMAYQTCTDQGCDPPAAVKFSAEVPVGQGASTSALLFVSEGSYGEVVEALEKADNKKTDNSAEESIGGDTQPIISVKDTPEQIAEMALLYDPNEKVNYLTLSELGGKRRNATTLWTALVGAFIGGMLLNLMPCVFPVLGLKVMGFVEQAGEEASKVRKHGIAFTAGLVVSMWTLAGIILTLKFSFGKSVNWGQQMGNPYFVGAIIILLFLLGLNMAGVFEIGTSLTRVGGSVQGKKGYTASFLSGILTTLIATPCSGPFLGAAMSYTLAQNAITAMFLFTVFALGIASPYLLLSFFPAMIKRLPRPGAWMETFKVTMAFALFATVAFFMKTFGAQTGVAGLSWLSMALVVLGLAAYFYGHWSPPHIKPFTRRWFGFVMPLVIAAIGLWMSYDAAGQQSLQSAEHLAGGLPWQEWNPGKIEYTLAKKKRVVWVDYTADW
jgi:thiol:disulfide interchange protein